MAVNVTGLAPAFTRPIRHPPRHAGDFLDPIADDRLAPLVWRVRVDAEAGRVTARSLLWPGYHFAAAIGAPAFGGVYVGDGRRNDDLVFQAPPPSDAALAAPTGAVHAY